MSTPGEKADVPELVAREWLISGWVDPADAGAKKLKADLDASLSAVTVDPADEFGHNVTAAGGE